MNKKVLIAITTYNQLDYTKILFSAYQKLNLDNLDLIVIDDVSTDATVAWCKEQNIKVIEKSQGKGLTDSWNLAYKYFKRHIEYDYLIIANNDIIIPTGAIEELIKCHDKWFPVCIVPLTTSTGCGHNPEQSILKHYSDASESYQDVQDVQDVILELKNSHELQFRQFMFDPIRMLMFSGFFFSFKRRIVEYERADGNLFNPENINYKNEDDLNWSTLLPNNEYAMLCKTSYVFHFKGASFANIKDARENNLTEFLINRNK